MRSKRDIPTTIGTGPAGVGKPTPCLLEMGHDTI